ncbi:MAG: hypothetical protein JXB07_21545 [Anaerolineae bacterium]|nr:hypothetical protein [Anaerolineae bacterium]
MNQLVIITHAVFIGLTPLIPIPVIDDLVKSIFYRRLIQELASTYRLSLRKDEIEALSEELSLGCFQGCLLGLVEQFLRRLLLKLSFVLEWRRSIDLVTRTYYVGYLIDYAFQRGWYAPGDVAQAVRLRVAIDQACDSINMTLVKRIIKTSFDRSSQLVRGTVRQMTDNLQGITFQRSRAWLRRWTPEQSQVAQVEEEVSQVLEQKSPHAQASLGDLIARLQSSLADLPKEHFDTLHHRLEAALEQPGSD